MQAELGERLGWAADEVSVRNQQDTGHRRRDFQNKQFIDTTYNSPGQRNKRAMKV